MDTCATERLNMVHMTVNMNNEDALNRGEEGLEVKLCSECRQYGDDGEVICNRRAAVRVKELKLTKTQEAELFCSCGILTKVIQTFH